MRPLRCFLIAALVIVFASGAPALAQVQISGPQSGTLGPDEYLVIGDIRVLPGETLTISPGTTFYHNGNWVWEISGQLNAEGVEGDSIYFVRQDPIDDHRWKGIRFQAGASDASTIDYCVIDHCYVNSGYLPPYLYGGGIYTNAVNITVRNSRISNCKAFWDGGGIYANNADILVDHCLISGNEAISGANGGGILLYGCPASTIQHSVIAGNKATGT